MRVRYNNPDSNSHVMGGCEKNPVFKGLYIKRHDIAVLAVAQTITASGYSSIFVGAGKHANLPDFAFCRLFFCIFQLVIASQWRMLSVWQDFVWVVMACE
jgi:hypothetical protein